VQTSTENGSQHIPLFVIQYHTDFLWLVLELEVCFAKYASVMKEMLEHSVS